MRHLLFNWILRKYYGEKLAEIIQHFVIDYNKEKEYYYLYDVTDDSTKK